MKNILFVLFSLCAILEASIPSLAFEYPILLLNARVIVNQPGMVRLATDWQVHLDKITRVYEIDKQSKSYSELRSIIGNKLALYENLNFYEKNTLSLKSQLSAFLKKLPAKHTFQILDPTQTKWPVVKNEDGSIDIAFRIYEPESKQKVFYRFKKEDPQFPSIEKIVGIMELNSMKLISPLFDDPKFNRLFTDDRIIYLNK